MYFGQSAPTQLPTEVGFEALAVAPDGTIFVASIGTGKSPTTGATSGTEIAVFGKTANGNVAPDRIIDVTALATPSGLGVYPGALAADANDTVYLGDQANADDVANGIYAFSASGALTAHVPTSANGLGWVTGLAIDASGDLVVQSVAIPGHAGQTALFASYSDYAASTLNVRGVTFGADGKTLYATSCDTDSVSVYPSGASSASRSIVGTLTKLLCPFAVAVDASGTIAPALI